MARLWATRRVGQLLEEIRLKGENKELKDEVAALAKEFGLVTPYTSYLVQEEEMMAGQVLNLDAAMDVEAPQFDEVVVSGVAASRQAMAAETGRDAVEASKAIRALQEATAHPVPPAPTGRAFVQGRTLRQASEAAWIDVEFDSDTDEVVPIKFVSEAYFTFLRLYPEAREFAQLGNEVTFFFKGRFVQIGPEGQETMTEAALRKFFT